eukprot:TRINITY_DN5284_c0_g2_i1.p1 TRINITY_DN5284_c0_g2~~TRINITY_DN5284_c0_g2_i1.p1  ORF type:complete len:133 (+),score=24.37 TRINITY_DN5284_c0_g2_i1:441-839(+)
MFNSDYTHMHTQSYQSQLSTYSFVQQRPTGALNSSAQQQRSGAPVVGQVDGLLAQVPAHGLAHNLLLVEVLRGVERAQVRRLVREVKGQRVHDLLLARQDVLPEALELRRTAARRIVGDQYFKLCEDEYLKL